MALEVALVACGVVAIAARVAAIARDAAALRLSSTLFVGRRSLVVDDGVTSHQRSSAEPPAALGASISGAGAVILGDVLAQLRLADERETAAFQRSLASFVHRRAMTSQVVLPVRRVPTVGACVRLRRPNSSGFDYFVALLPVIVVGHLSNIRFLGWRRLFTDDVMDVSIATISRDDAGFHCAADSDQNSFYSNQSPSKLNSANLSLWRF